ncbi:MAG: DUF2283 domain-containing protein [Chloroflexota bacterium]|nr:DUF2283 domain-containing protein [Chloroflexota bacterium]
MPPYDLNHYLALIPALRQSPAANLWSSYDEQGDVLYISFDQPRPATDSELTDDDVILRYDGDDLIGITILHASKR